MKKCSKCKEEKELSEFNKSRKGITTSCKACIAIIDKEIYDRDKEKILKRKKSYYQRNKEKTWRNNAETKWRTYGIKDMTIERYDVMMEKQNHCCDICGGHKDSFTRRLAVDHCHDTGEARGLLCSNCNAALGALGDNLEGVMKAVGYLKRFEI